MNPIWLIGLAALWLAGCAPAEKKAVPTGQSPALKKAVSTEQPPAQSNATPPEKSVARQVVEGSTGKTAVDAGGRTKAKIKAIEKQRRQNFEEIPP